MAIEIKELVVRFSVVENRQMLPDDSLNSIVSEARIRRIVSEVFEEIKEKQERKIDR